ncbi:NADP-dependent glyceraldehyde-3-phosphate dehydrogenase [Thermogladius sp. 4427co]|uniref:NADP-dependent glyceraldehyde-3-phosphate dehydrogenase n=1 Tax=Thermogladius sp. 4427co TaxID=3450718 RepID=UPI003F79907B
MNSYRPSEFFSNIYKISENTLYYKAYGAGEWFDTSSWTPVHSPIDNSLLGYVPRLTYSDVERVIDRVYSSGRWSIRNTPGYKRLQYMFKIADLMEKYAEDFINVLIYNTGKTYSQARGEVLSSISRLRDAPLDARKVPGEYIAGDWDASTLETDSIVRKEPYGVVLAIIPFNYPLFDTVSKFVYSTVSGNAIIIKPPSADPLPVLLFARIVEESGFPRDAFAVLTISGKEADPLVADKRISVVSLTGSSSTGRHVLSVGGIKQYIMELGGGDPAIVLSDADIEQAAKSIAAGIYSFAGQRCDAIKLILAEKPIYDKLSKLIIEELKKVRVGDPRDPSTVVGPLIDSSAVNNMIAAINDAIEKGGRVLYGGRHLGGNYVEPTLIEFESHENMVKTKLYREEVFAPIALITWFDKDDDAIRLANGRDYGLDAAVFGRDLDRIRKYVRYLEVGAIYVNDMPRHGVGYYPFGGRKNSGIGREGIGYSVEYVMATKTIVFNYKGKGIYNYLV